ncbi:hypothetical protein P8452_33239 [Trifolium repens]|nr:hypothetical protein P8452_33239 [Trifolium repens]
MLLVTGVSYLFGDGITNVCILIDGCGRVAQIGKTVRLLNWIILLWFRSINSSANKVSTKQLVKGKIKYGTMRPFHLLEILQPLNIR